MSVSPQKNLAILLSELAKMRSAEKRASDACARMTAELEAQGFKRAAIDRVLELLATNGADQHETLSQIQVMLELAGAPVQIDLIGRYETPVSKDAALDALTDQGYWARLQGHPRMFKAETAAERQAFMVGWDEADAVLTRAGP